MKQNVQNILATKIKQHVKCKKQQPEVNAAEKVNQLPAKYFSFTQELIVGNNIVTELR